MLAILGAFLTTVLGVLGAVAPARVARLVGIEPLGGFGLSEVRATYGGFFIALGGAAVELAIGLLLLSGVA